MKALKEYYLMVVFTLLPKTVDAQRAKQQFVILTEKKVSI